MEDLSKVILQIGLSACIFIGPFLFFYIRSVLRQQQKIQPNERWQLLGLLVISIVGGIIFSYPVRPDLWNPEIVQGIYAVWLAYVAASGYILRSLILQLFTNRSTLSVTQQWLIVVFGTNALICLVFNSVLYFGFPSYIFGPITFSFVFYALAAFLFFFPNSRTIIEGEKARYSNKKIGNSQATQIQAQLRQLMQEEKCYKNPDLKLRDMARQLEVSPHTLSQYLNDNLGKSFSDFINEYRVKAACQLIQTEHNLTVEGIGIEVGFRSKSSFYTAFKKQQGTTPNQFAKREKTH